MAISSQAPQECGEGSETSAWSPDRAVEHHERAAIKRCNACGEEKPLSQFEKNRSFYRGKCRRCRQDDANTRYAQDSEARLRCNLHWRTANPEKKRASDAKVYARNQSRILRQKKRYHELKYESLIRPYKAQYLARADVIESRREYNRRYHLAYYAKHKAAYLAKFIARRSLKERAVPPWADLKAIETFYLAARDLTERTGIKHEVDHRIPLKSEVVCGLHVETNLRVITRNDNRKKSNRLIDEIVRTAEETCRTDG